MQQWLYLSLKQTPASAMQVLFLFYDLGQHDSNLVLGVIAHSDSDMSRNVSRCSLDFAVCVLPQEAATYCFKLYLLDNRS